MEQHVARRTVYFSEHTENVVRGHMRDRDSFSAAVTRLIEAGSRAENGAQRPSYAGIGAGPSDLGENAEQYLAEVFEQWED